MNRFTDTYYPAYLDGHLLVKGGLADQPARYLDYIDRIRSLEATVQAKWDELRPKEE